MSVVNRVGTPELSHYTALDNLFDAIGDQLTPKVRAVVQYKESSSGQPDLGFFTSENEQPDRGVVEVKPSDYDLDLLIASEQVHDYWQRHKLVLVTNLREFALVGQDSDGAKHTLERYSLAESNAAFDELLKHRIRAANRHGVSLGEYLQRVMSHRSTISEPRDLARLLASYARDALQRVEHAAEEEDSLKPIREAIEQALGMSFEGEDGGKFFRSTLVQTLFYGVFAAWVLWARAGTSSNAGGRFGWKDTVYELRAPVLRMLFHQITDPGRLERLDLSEVLDWTEAALERVDREAFLQRFSEGEAVQYFYEPFLEAFDPELRKDLGVWYTPREVVRYMVARVDRSLRDDLGIAKGLADENVYVLDPCCGTGAFLVETLRRIAETEQTSGGGAAWAESVRQAASTRVFGFEIMPAPLVVSHLEIGLALEQMGAGLAPDQRAGVFLTNALTGWEPHTTKPLPFPELEQERHAATNVKQKRAILVVLGNPPYNGFAGVAVEEEDEMLDAYRVSKGVEIPDTRALQDLYVRFFRVAERRIAEKTGAGVVCLISNCSWLDGRSFAGMRERYLDAFDIIRIDHLNGDKYRTGKLTPDGKPDPSVFSSAEDPIGIQVGTAITTLVRKSDHAPVGEIGFRNIWGTAKRDVLVDTADAVPTSMYERLAPDLSLGLPFAPTKIGGSWSEWPMLPDLFPVQFGGVNTNRDGFLVAMDRHSLEARISDYFDPALPNDEIGRRHPVAMGKRARFDPERVRRVLLARGGPTESGYIRYAYRPFDTRWLYWEADTKLLNEKRPDYRPHVFAANVWLSSAPQLRKGEAEPQACLTQQMACLHLIERGANMFPLYLRDDQFGEEVDGIKRTANLSELAQSYIESMNAEPEDLFHHVLATLHDPAYREANAGGLRMGWPRIPLPDSADEFSQSAVTGRRLARLLDTESDVTDLLDTSIAVPTTVDGQPMQPNDFNLTANWGHYGANQAVMPGQGNVKRRGQMVDVYLNDQAYWKDVPIEVWEYRLGGYQVLKKWLSYRESKVLGRGLEVSEVSWFSEVARRIWAMQPLV